MVRLHRSLTDRISNAGRYARNKYVHLFFFLIAIAPCLSAQESQGSVFDRMFFGGNMGASFGNITFIEVSPLIGYNITDAWQAGTRISYQYYSDNDLNFSGSIYGGSLFTRYFIWEDLFAQTEAEAISWPFGRNGRSTIYNYYVGGGYVARLGPISGIAITLLYNLNAESPMAVSNPTINIGFVYGLPR